MQDPNDYRFTPFWGTGWGEKGYGSISFFPQRDPLRAPMVLYAVPVLP